MNLVETIRENLIAGIIADKSLNLAREDCERISLDAAPSNFNNDLATNAALILAQSAKQAPLKLGERIQAILQKNPYIDNCSLVKPGFINIEISLNARLAVLVAILQQKHKYGCQKLAQKKIVNIEFVSANPTGPLHIGHTRGAVVGDVLANILEKRGYKVLREYYVNDRGEQMSLLAKSLHWRYCQLFEKKAAEKNNAIPQGFYPGDYLIVCAQALKARDGEKWLQKNSEVWSKPILEFARAYMMQQISNDLQKLGVDFRGNFVSENALLQSGKIENLIKILQQKGVAKLGRMPPPKAARGKEKTQEIQKTKQNATNANEAEREHLLLQTKRFGDNENRVLRTADDKITYFTSDIAYHVDKIKRGAELLIDIFGADHSGHAQRLQAALLACHYSNEVPAHTLKVVSCQIVRLMESGKPMKMSKRGGAFLDLNTLIDRVGKDAVRFLMLTRKSDAPLDFDLDAAVAKSHDNPVFYVQYAHARCHSVLKMAQKTQQEQKGGDEIKSNAYSDDSLAQADFSKLEQKTERALIRDLALFPRTLGNATKNLEPHRLVFALIALAAALHAWWNEGNKDRSRRIIYSEDEATTRARLALVRAAQIVLAIGLQICGVDAPNEMN